VGESSGAAGARLDYLSDALGSVTATVNQNARVQNTYRYKPYGSQLAKTGAGADPAFQWVGMEGYRQTGKKFSDVYVRARHYATAVGRWTTKDPIDFEELAYRYSFDNPTTYTDPSGNFPLVCAAACTLCAPCAVDLALVCSDCGTDLKCWRDCIAGTISELPPAIKWGCGIACAGCIACLAREAVKRLCQPPCSPAERAALQGAVNLLCKKSGKTSCNSTQNCATLKANLAKNSACAAARQAINSRCCGGGDPGHRQAEANALRAAAKCAALITSKGC